MENQVRKRSNGIGRCSSVPVLNSRRVYKSNHCTKVKFIPIGEVKKLAPKTQKKRNSRHNSSRPRPTLMKKVHAKTSMSSNQSESGKLLKDTGAENICEQPNAVVLIKAPSCSITSVEGSSSSNSKLIPYMKDETLKIDVIPKSDQSSTSELIKAKGYETSSVLKSCTLEDGSGDAECQDNNFSFASTVSCRTKTGRAHQEDCLNQSALQHGDLSSNWPACERFPPYGPAAERVWKSVPKGNFEILDLPCELRQCEGFTAHCAAKICTKAHTFLKNIEEEVLFHSHPRNDFWLGIFKADGPDVLDISVYFYPGNFERSRREYASLLKYIEQEDLMLRYVMHHVELLVYPSKVLPLHSQKIGGSYFLWGAVRFSKG